jgi:PTH2 family peptidyl-tRNA hydrolase
MFKMVIVINSSLKMSMGKTASQAAHSAVSLYIKAKANPRKHLLFFNEIDSWMRLGGAKVVLKGTSEQHLLELEQKATAAELLTVTIRDAGRTEVERGSLTCLSIFGKVDQVDKITGELSLIK